MTVHLRDGRVLRHEVKAAKGTPANPLGEPELLEKFRECAAGILSPSAIPEAAERLLSLEAQSCMAALMGLLAGPGSTAD